MTAGADTSVPDDVLHIVRMTVDLFVIPTRQDPVLDSVEWHCTTCRHSDHAEAIPEASTRITAHLYQHARNGAGSVTP
jgi:hypothetical protein